MSGTYTTIQGDMWDAIAFKAMGSEDYTGALMAANRAYLEYYTFPAGVKITVPDVAASALNSLPPWKRTGT